MVYGYKTDTIRKNSKIGILCRSHLTAMMRRTVMKRPTMRTVLAMKQSQFIDRAESATIIVLDQVEADKKIRK